MSEFPAAFDELKQILELYEDRLVLTEDAPEKYALDTPYSEKWERELFFGAVKIGKSYVSFHLMPVYMYPDLLDDISDALRKRMQGKSCFNFTAVDPELFDELKDLTERGLARLEAEGIVPE